ncbi:hypothetical protein OIU77_013210 [Salix suchowensis]|uniref:Secreted protein n=1 Tax=Salix suchowensis TaxID=1278906 RepID=A0ABQ8ZT30_9ROSI|nr:hypothetical protein OIU77_013210 [Salix suchowensis]
MQILRRAKLGCASVSALAFTRHSHWRGSIGAIFWPGQCYWEVTAIWHEHINSQRMSPKSLTSPGLSFPCIEYIGFTLSFDEVNLLGLGPILW